MSCRQRNTDNQLLVRADNPQSCYCPVMSLSLTLATPTRHSLSNCTFHHTTRPAHVISVWQTPRCWCGLEPTDQVSTHPSLLTLPVIISTEGLTPHSTLSFRAAVVHNRHPPSLCHLTQILSTEVRSYSGPSVLNIIQTRIYISWNLVSFQIQPIIYH